MEWLAEPQEYRHLATSPEACALAYRELFKQPLVAYDIQAIRTHLNKDCVLGSGKFQDEIEAILGRRAKIAPQGRPRKPKDGDLK
jgi:putative transposase